MLVFLGAWTLWFLGGKAVEKEMSAKNTAQNATTTSVTKRFQPDSDGDGLKDWEEELWQTDKNNADTDGDGVPDGEEVKNRRNPKKEGPEDILESQEEKAIAAIHIAAVNKDEPLESMETASSQNISYTLLDINLVDSSDIAFIKEYGLKMGETLKTYSNIDIVSVGSSTLRVIDGGDAAELENIRKIKDGHLKVVRVLKEMEVPASAGEIHLNILNSLFRISQLVFMMEQASREPLLALESAREHEYALLDAYNSLKELNNYFKERNIIFEKDEGVDIKI